MEEVLREYVRPVNVVMRNGKLYMRIYDDLYVSLYNDVLQAVYPENILVLLDGVPLLNFNRIFSYDPLKIKKLDVVPRRYMLGNVGYNGIVSFESFHGRFDAFDLAPGTIAVDYEGLQLQREFYSPDYTVRNNHRERIPDFRTTLSWFPQVAVNKNGKATLQFFTSDISGRYTAILQGFSPSGEAVAVSASFTVE